GRRAAHELPPPRVDAPDARLRLRRARKSARSLCARRARTLSFLQLRRCHVRDSARGPMRPEFTVQARDGAARVGRLVSAHGTFSTPAFMRSGTNGSVKGMAPKEPDQLGAQIMLVNAFHLMLRAGADIIAAHGGLHGFMRWNRAILTVSGGFQVFSLRSL